MQLDCNRIKRICNKFLSKSVRLLSLFTILIVADFCFFSRADLRKHHVDWKIRFYFYPNPFSHRIWICLIRKNCTFITATFTKFFFTFAPWIIFAESLPIFLSRAFSRKRETHCFQLDTISQRRASNSLAKIGLFQRSTNITLLLSITPNCIILCFFFSSSTKTLVRMFCSLFRLIGSGGATTLRHVDPVRLKFAAGRTRHAETSTPLGGGKRGNVMVRSWRRGWEV